MFTLAGLPLAVRIGRSIERLKIVKREVCVTQWLDGLDIPVVRPYEGVAQPLVVQERPVSVWHLVAAQYCRPRVDDLAEHRKAIVHRGGVIDARHSAKSGVEIGTILDLVHAEKY